MSLRLPSSPRGWFFTVAAVGALVYGLTHHRPAALLVVGLLRVLGHLSR